MIPSKIEPGQVWREKRSGRLIRITESDAHATGPGYVYCDSGERAYTHIFNFILWKDFEFISPAGGGGGE